MPNRLMTITALCLLAMPLQAQNSSNSPDALQRQLAEQGDAKAQYDLGDRYEYGRGVDQNDIEALKWYKQAAIQGVAFAQYRLAVMHDNGWGTSPDDTVAVKWYRKAAQQGHPLAQHDLAFMYVAGAGVPQDSVRAYMWLDIAVAQGSSFMLGHLHRVGKNMTSAEVAEAQLMAREWIARHQP